MKKEEAYKGIKSIETYYGGYKFRSRNEAKWAVYLDNIGADWEYEPEGFHLPGGICYLPDFRIRVKNPPNAKTPKEFYLECKGKPNREDGIKCSIFSHEYPLLIVGNIYDLPDNFYKTLQVDDEGMNEGCERNSFVYIDGSFQLCMLCASQKGGIGLYVPYECDKVGDNPADIYKTRKAIEAAKQARFEFGETPQAAIQVGTIIDFTGMKEILNQNINWGHSNPLNFIDSEIGVVIELVSNSTGSVRFLLKDWTTRTLAKETLEKIKPNIKIMGRCNINEVRQTLFKESEGKE